MEKCCVSAFTGAARRVKLRVCILTESSPFTWTPHYVAAFRQRCDVITVGPTLSRETVESWGMGDLAHLITPNDIVVPEKELPNLFSLLPDGWRPHLVIGIARAALPLLQTPSRLACPSAFIAIDTWQCPDDYLDSIHYDFVFAAQREMVPLLTAYGARHVSWLPLACAPEAHHPVDVPEDYDISFVGSFKHRVHRRRAEFLALLQQHFRTAIHNKAYGETMRRITCAGKIAFNHSAVEEINMRIFEAMAMGRALITNRDSAYNGLLDLFEDGKHLITYTDEDELIDKLRYYLEHDDERNAIARAGMEEVLARHTYLHRVDAILNTLSAHIPDIESRADGRERSGTRLRDYLPSVPGSVVDVGMSVEGSKYSLKKSGVSKFIGVAANLQQAESRRGSYDRIEEWPAEHVQDADTVVVSNIGELDCPIEQVLRRVHAMLRHGGALILRLDDGDIDTSELEAFHKNVSYWLKRYDFNLTLASVFQQENVADDSPSEKTYRITARKRIKPLVELFLQPLTRLKDHGVPLEEVKAGIPPEL